MAFLNLEKVGRDFTLYQHDRTSLFYYFNNIVPISIEYILFGCNVISEELNTLLFKSVPKFIRQTCRFNNYYPQPLYNWIGNKFLQLTSHSPYKYINSINKTNQMTANVQAISIINSKLSKIMSN
jgi:hypothetical protein